MDHESIALARAVGEQVLRDEHGFFMDEGTDNSEHVPRSGRIAESVRRALEQEGCDAVEADLVERELIDLGRALFVEEWMRPLDGDDQAPAEAEALAEFERCLREGQG
jgi:ribosomal protein S19E (S16A)